MLASVVKLLDKILHSWNMVCWANTKRWDLSANPFNENNIFSTFDTRKFGTDNQLLATSSMDKNLPTRISCWGSDVNVEYSLYLYLDLLL